jgi:uncharacterized membrane protein
MRLYVRVGPNTAVGMGPILGTFYMLGAMAVWVIYAMLYLVAFAIAVLVLLLQALRSAGARRPRAS